MNRTKQQFSMSRRQFIGTIMAASAVGTLVSACSESSWQLGIFTRPWSKMHYLQAFDSIAEAGFKQVGLMSHVGGRIIGQDTPAEEAIRIGEEARERGLNIVTVSGHSFNKNGSLDENVAGLKQLIENCAACNSPFLMLNGIAEEEYADTYYRMIAESCEYAASLNIGITLKPHGGTNGTGAECKKRIRQVGHENFTLWYDPGNIYYYSKGEINPVDDIDDVADICTGMCIKDYKLPGIVDVTPGNGMVNFPDLFSRMKQEGFTKGPLLIECLNPGDNKMLIAQARKAKEYIEGLLS